MNLEKTLKHYNLITTHNLMGGLVLKHADDGSSHNNKTTPGDCKHLAKHLLTFEEFLFEHPLTSHVIKTAYYF